VKAKEVKHNSNDHQNCSISGQKKRYSHHNKVVYYKLGKGKFGASIAIWGWVLKIQ
jgi:hypothetical protein